MRARAALPGLLGAAAAALIGAGAAHGKAPARAAPALQELAMDAGWIRRDETRCSERSGWRVAERMLTVWSDSSSVLLWQIPLLNAAPFTVSSQSRWVRRCERPPLSLWEQLRDADAAGQVTLIEVGALPELSWQWQIAEESAGSDADGARVSVGVTLQKRGGTKVREISYVWSRGEPAGTWKTEERTIVPGIFSIRAARFVVRSEGPEGPWLHESRQLDRDMQLLFRERAGKVLRVLVKLHDEPHRAHVRAGVRALRFAPAADSPAAGRADTAQ